MSLWTYTIMASRWFLLCIGTALVQGIVGFSPVPVPDEEWEEFYRTLRDPAYRLPTTTRPRHYEVTLTPYFDNVPVNRTAFTFDGEVTVHISPTEANVTEIVMHCNDLTIDSLSVRSESNVEINTPDQNLECSSPYSFLRIRTITPLQLGQEYIVKMTFRGNLQTNMRGFYRSWYNDKTGKRWMGTTQFQPGHARQAFPCYDEPGFKATFEITIVREQNFSPTISNMPLKTRGPVVNGRVAETFHTTPVTSTYLLAFIVSHYIVVATNNNTTRPFDIYARDNTGSTGEWSLEMGELLLDAMDKYTQIPYYNMATNMNMKQAAIPDFSAGAMENWGLLTYREALILYDPRNSNHHYKQRVANIVSHEIAHMWFGNLVTCAWWDNLWLNEGFARFYQYYLTHSVKPDMGYDIRFIVEQLQSVMLSDSLDSAHALTNPAVNDPSSVSAHFSSITYARGASVIRMTQHLLGDSTFVKALRRYLKERQYDVAEPHHLFKALDAAAVEDNALSAYNGVTIDTYFRSWSEKAGHPLLTVTIDQRTGRMIVTQSRWERNTGVSQYPSLWYVPITWTRGGAPDFNNLKPSQIISAQTTVIQRGTTGLEWVLFNKQESGFYRVNYDDINWSLLTRELRGANRTVIHELNRAQIVDDLFALARAGVKSYDRIYNILSFLEFEDAYAPWIAAINGFNFVIRRLAHYTTNLQKLYDNIKSLSVAITRRLGYSEITGESYMDGLLRMHVLTFLCNIGHEQCVSEAKRNFQNWRNGEFVAANMRPWVYCVGLREGTDEDFTHFWNRYLTEDLASEKIVMLEAAGCTNNETSLWRYLDAIVALDDAIRAQDYNTALNSAVSGNEANTMRMFEWLKNNIAPATTALGSLATPISYIAGRLLNEQQITEFQAWLEANRDVIGTAYNTGINSIASTRSNLEWSARRMGEMERYFEVGYVEDIIVIDGGEGQPEVDGGEETEEKEEEEEGTKTLVPFIFLLVGSLSADPLEFRSNFEYLDYSTNLDDPKYRLLDTVQPTEVFADLDVYLRESRFNGFVQITVNVRQNLSQIVLHQNVVAIQGVNVLDSNSKPVPLQATNPFETDSYYEILKINFDGILAVGTYVISISYLGRINENPLDRGFYKGYYYFGNQKRQYATTQFQPYHARKAFPCFDEPQFKSRFVISITRDRDLSPSFSNMPISETSVISANRIRETFLPTPLVSSYLVAFHVSDFVATNSTSTASKPFQIISRQGPINQHAYAAEMGLKITNEMDAYFDIGYYNMGQGQPMKNDHIALPDFPSGAMENWGMVNYREAYLLYDPNHTNLNSKINIATIMAHELAHKWFGNLVTCFWWSNLWLNESFASFFEYFAAHFADPSLELDEQFVVSYVHSALSWDAGASATPMNWSAVVDNPSVSSHFSTTSYAKGASVLKMLEHFVGFETFRNALRMYLKNKSYDIAYPEDMYAAFRTAVSQDPTFARDFPNIDIGQVFDSWVQNPGSPVVNVYVNMTSGEIILNQERFQLTGTPPSSLWQIPISWTHSGNMSFENTRPSFVLTEKSAVIRKDPGHHWVMLNIGQSGLYRVNYDDHNWEMIAPYLRNNRNNVHKMNRAQIVNDVLFFIRAGTISIRRAFDVLSFLKDETDYYVWAGALGQFDWIRGRLEHLPGAYEEFNTYLLDLMEAAIQHVGYNERSNDSTSTILNRMQILNYACNLGHEGCKADSLAKWQAFRTNESNLVPVNARRYVYCTGLREGDAADYNFLYQKYNTSENTADMVVMLRALACTKDRASLEHYMFQTMYNDRIRIHDRTNAFQYALQGNSENLPIVLNFLYNNFQAISNNYGGPARLTIAMNALATFLRDFEHISEFQTWLYRNQLALGESFSAGVNVISSSIANLRWGNNVAVELVNAIRSTNNSASSIAVSVVTLLAAFAVNLLQ
ncbi:unnamed protein product [Parnassius mnemosyne]|uniref:Aminopeptidase N n=1 Tax=Parnassius mnemosyne TaxID=213953 RepID=A0AAV1LY17_9NEOP